MESSRVRRASGSLNKTKPQLELPKINKTTVLLRGKQNQTHLVKFSEKVSWVEVPIDYSILSTKQISDEYTKLRKQLTNINAEVAKAIQKVTYRSLRKQRMNDIVDPAKSVEIRDKQIQNNQAILNRLRKQSFQLQKRAHQISSTQSKNSLEEQLQATRKQYEKTKAKIKQLKLKNKSIGDSITNCDDIIQEIRRLEYERDALQKRKSKLHSKNDHIYSQISTVQFKLESISDNYTIAQNYFEQYGNKIQQAEKKKEMEMKLRQAKHNLQIVTKKNEISLNTKQQKYHSCLKALESQIQKISTIQQKISAAQLQNIHYKNVIAQYEQIMKQNILRLEQQANEKQRKHQEVFFTDLNPPSSNNSLASTPKKQELDQYENYLTEKQTQENNNFQKVKNVIDDELPEIQKQISEKDMKQLKQAQYSWEDLEQQQKQNKKDNKKVKKQKAETNKSIDLDEQQDVIMDLDQKFHSSPKNGHKSRHHQRETQLGDEVRQDSLMVDDDDEILEFQTKIKEEQFKRKSKEHLALEIEELTSQLENIKFINHDKEPSIANEKSDKQEEKQVEEQEIEKFL